MAKIQQKYSFSNAIITKEKGEYTITELEKDGSQDYNLTDILDKFLDKDGVSLTIGVDGKPDPIE